MTITSNHFRALILLSLACGMVSLFITLTFPSLVPEPLRVTNAKLIHSSTDSTSTLLLVLQLVAFITLILGSISGFVGMFMFKSWARPLNVALAFSTFVIWPVMGYNLSSGWGQAFSDFALLLWGAIIAMAYFSSVNERFNHERANPSINRDAALAHPPYAKR